MAASSGPPLTSLPNSSSDQPKPPSSKHSPFSFRFKHSSSSRSGLRSRSGSCSAAATAGASAATVAVSAASAPPPQPRPPLYAAASSSAGAVASAPSISIAPSPLPPCPQAVAGASVKPVVISDPGVISAPLSSTLGVNSSAAKVLPQGTKPSFSSIVRPIPGPSFIRDHSIAVAAFGAIPDVAAEPIISSIAGVPSVFFSSDELLAAEYIFRDAIVMKFTSGRPSWETCYSSINSWGLSQEFIMGPLDSKSILLRFRDHRDMITVLARSSNYIGGFPYRAFRWNRSYNSKEDAAVVPVWVSFPHLPIPFYVPSLLKGIANSIGKFLCFDRATSLMTRASSAKVCIEVDLRLDIPTHVWIGVNGKFLQPIIYEKIPSFCQSCRGLGHRAVDCKKKYPQLGVQDPLIYDVDPSAQQPVAPGHSKSTTEPSAPPGPLAQPTAAQVLAPICHDPPAQHLPTPPVPSAASQPHTTQQYPSPSVQLQNAAIHCSPGDAEHPPSSFNKAFPLLSAAQAPVFPVPINKLSDFDNFNQSSGTMNACMTDFHNQHPKSLSPMLLQHEDRTCTPGVCRNDEVIGKADFVNLGHSESTTSPFDRGQMLQRPIADQTVAQPPIPPSDISPSAMDQTAMLQHRQFIDGSSAVQAPGPPALTCQQSLTNHSNQRPQSPSKDLMQTENFRSTPPVRRNAGSVSHPVSEPSSSSDPSELDRVVSDQAKSLQGALERLKAKVQVGGYDHHSSLNYFQPLHDDLTDDDEESEFDSASDDDLGKQISKGYQSADGRSTLKSANLASSGIKINKRHPNAPLNAKLRSRKSSCPSSP